MKLLLKYLKKTYRLIFTNYFGFIQGHKSINTNEIKEIHQLLKNPNQNIVEEYENKFSSLVGNGSSISYASGRMGFFELMKYLKIGNNDEIVILGYTCAVMVNAIIKIGAKPIFSDIDPETFGSCIKSIKEKTSPRTKLIVAQHSFGIPCDIKKIVEFAREKDIFLLEDCALTLGSKVDGKTAGDFGDAALFSSDHGKPINSIIGGFIYSNNIKIINDLKQLGKNHKHLSKSHQNALYKRFLVERKYCNPTMYGKLVLKDAFFRFLGLNNDPFLNDDRGITTHSSYPYPAKLPSFIAKIGIIEIKKWPQESSNRKDLLDAYINKFKNSKHAESIPNAYFQENYEITPLRFIFIPNDPFFKTLIEYHLNTSWIWTKPIEATNTSLHDFGLKKDDCLLSRSLGSRVIQLPCNLSKKKFWYQLSLMLDNIA